MRICSMPTRRATVFTGPGLVEIGDKFYSVNELVYGGEPIEGHGTQYLFASDDRDIKVQIELLEVTFRNDAFYFDKAKVTVIQKGKLPFTANAKGVSGCPKTASQPQTASASPDLPAGIPIGDERVLGGYVRNPGCFAPANARLRERSLRHRRPVRLVRRALRDQRLLSDVANPLLSRCLSGIRCLCRDPEPAARLGRVVDLAQSPGLGGQPELFSHECQGVGIVRTH
jgi:hypothetical protein